MLLIPVILNDRLKKDSSLTQQLLAWPAKASRRRLELHMALRERAGVVYQICGVFRLVGDNE